LDGVGAPELKSRPEAAVLLYKPPESSIASTTAIPYLTIKFCRFVFEIDFVLGGFDHEPAVDIFSFDWSRISCSANLTRLFFACPLRNRIPVFLPRRLCIVSSLFLYLIAHCGPLVTGCQERQACATLPAATPFALAAATLQPRPA
jgi:hypothetical protein